PFERGIIRVDASTCNPIRTIGAVTHKIGVLGALTRGESHVGIARVELDSHHQNNLYAHTPNHVPSRRRRVIHVSSQSTSPSFMLISTVTASMPPAPARPERLAAVASTTSLKF